MHTVTETDVVRPLSLLLDLSKIEWRALEEEILAIVAETGSCHRIRIGLVLPPLPTRAAWVSMGPYEEQSGRPLVSTRSGSLPHYREHLMMTLIQEADLAHMQGDHLSVADLQRAECFSISDVAPALGRKLIDLCARTGALIAAIGWDETSAVATDLLWNGLILRHLVTDHIIITDYLEYPEVVDYSGDEPKWRSDRTPEGAAVGFFYNDVDGPHIEDDYRYLPIPRDVLGNSLSLPPQTPLQRALHAAGKTPVLRISGHDRREMQASFRLPVIHHQFPDLIAVEKKVRKYCLNRSNSERKWEGFLAHGYGYRRQDSVILAAHIAGALLGKFSPKEAVATSQGELQFSVGIAIPSSSRYRALLTTAWIAEPDHGFRLTSAYVDRQLPEYASSLPVLEPLGPIEDCWAIILEHALSTVAGWATDGVWAQPRVFLPRSGPTRAFARDLVRRGEGYGDFNRVAVGGRSILVPVGPQMSWSQAAFVATYVQMQLGLRGILSLADVWVD